MRNLYRWQDSGGAETLQSANIALTVAKKETPVELHKYFEGRIRKFGTGYEWYWQLR